MKIQSAEVHHVRLPHEEPIVNAPPFPAQMRDYVTLQLRTDDGIEGIGFTAFSGKLTAALKAAVAAFGDLIVGDDALGTEAIAARLRDAEPDLCARSGPVAGRPGRLSAERGGQDDCLFRRQGTGGRIRQQATVPPGVF